MTTAMKGRRTAKQREAIAAYRVVLAEYLDACAALGAIEDQQVAIVDRKLTVIDHKVQAFRRKLERELFKREKAFMGSSEAKAADRRVDRSYHALADARRKCEAVGVSPVRRFLPPRKSR